MWQQAGGECWEIVSAIGTCLGAVATFLAAAVALWQTSLSSFPRVRAWLTYSYKENERSAGVFVSFIASVEVANVGIARESLKELQYTDRVLGNSGALPCDKLFQMKGAQIMLESGESISASFFPLSVVMHFCDDSNWFTRLKSKLITPCRFTLVAPSGRHYKVKMTREARRSLKRYSQFRLRCPNAESDN